MNSSKLLFLLEKNKFDFFTGVPCSYIKKFCEILKKRESNFHVPAVREDIAVGLAAGAYMGGKSPVIYMQNSGFGYSLEAFASLNFIYKIPVLLMLTYRGPQDKNMEEHIIMGKHTESILKKFGFKYTILESKITDSKISKIKQYLNEHKLPYCLLIKKGALE